MTRSLDGAVLEDSELFDKCWYIDRYGDVARLGMSPVDHYLQIGARLLRDPGPNFSTARYLALFPDLLEAGINPLVHHLANGNLSQITQREVFAEAGLESAQSSDVLTVKAAFDSGYYLENNPDIAQGGGDAFIHYLSHGWREGRDPSPHFSTSYYLQTNPDIDQGGVNPFIHYVLHGCREGRQALPFERRLQQQAWNPKVSVVIPNFNHGRFLAQRIDCILAQTYANLELLILDDCSTDDSRDIINGYCERSPERVRSIFNTRNSGNVFRQWRKGVENCDGELIWICESDDFCDSEFLAKLVPKFKDRSVNLAFGRIQFADKDGNSQAGLDGYREGAESGIWGRPFSRPAAQWFAGAFGVNNVIANVGGCVWRRQDLSPAVWREAQTYSILGDWFLYCHLANGGQIAFDPEAVAYFRQHGSNTSVAAFIKPAFYDEHRRLMTLVKNRWFVPDTTVENFYAKVLFQYTHFKAHEHLESLDKYIDVQQLLSLKRQKQHVLIAFLGFTSGGGELFPINLANALHRSGCIVSMLALDMSDVNVDMLQSLDRSIAVYDASAVEEWGIDKFLVDAGITLVHSHMVSLEWFIFEKCKATTDIPYVVTLHGSYEASRVSNERLAYIVPRVSHWVYTADKNLLPIKSWGIPQRLLTKLANAMPIDPRPFPKTRSEMGISEEAVVFTLVARGIVRKGWRAVISAFGLLRKNFPGQPAHLLLCGDGPETDRYREEVGQDSSITFLGYQSCIHGLYQLSDCAVVPTRFSGESYPLCIIQSLQVGTPLIASRVGEIENMILPPELHSGIVIDAVRDTGAFVDSLYLAMAQMLDPKRREAFSAAAKVNGVRFQMDQLADQYKDIYESVVQQGRLHDNEGVTCQSD